MRRALLLEVLPELASDLPAEEAESARRSVVVEVNRVEAGIWRPDRSEPEPGHLGFIVLEGVIIRELVVGGSRSIELLNQGDILRPWQEDTASFSDATWRAITRVEMATLGPQTAAAICHSPALVATLIDRAMRRSRSLAVHAAIESIVGLERRLVLLFWHFAEHWGTVGTDGIEVPLSLTHETLAHLVGARRPSVSAALANLAREGRIERHGEGWVLHGDPPGMDLS